MGGGGPGGKGGVSREPAQPAARGVAELLAESESPRFRSRRLAGLALGQGVRTRSCARAKPVTSKVVAATGKGRSGTYSRSKIVFLFSEAKGEETGGWIGCLASGDGPPLSSFPYKR